MGKEEKMLRWPIILDEITREERSNGELIKGLLAGGIPIEWKEIIMGTGKKKNLTKACRISAVISKTIAAIWGTRIKGERNDLTEYYKRRDYKFHLRAEEAIEEHYNGQQITWEEIEELTAGTGMESIEDLLTELYGENQGEMEEEEEVPREENIGERIKRRRLQPNSKIRWDNIPGLHRRPEETGTVQNQHFYPPEIPQDFHKKYLNRQGCEHDRRKTCKSCAKNTRKITREKHRLRNRKRKEIEREEGRRVKAKKIEKEGEDKETERELIEERKGNKWRRIPTWETITKAKEERVYKQIRQMVCKYNDSFPQDKAPVKTVKNNMRSFGRYTKPIKKYKGVLKNNRRLGGIGGIKVETEMKGKQKTMQLTRQTTSPQTQTNPLQPKNTQITSHNKQIQITASTREATKGQSSVISLIVTPQHTNTSPAPQNTLKQRSPQPTNQQTTENSPTSEETNTPTLTTPITDKAHQKGNEKTKNKDKQNTPDIPPPKTQSTPNTKNSQPTAFQNHTNATAKVDTITRKPEKHNTQIREPPQRENIEHSTMDNTIQEPAQTKQNGRVEMSGTEGETKRGEGSTQEEQTKRPKTLRKVQMKVQKSTQPRIPSTLTSHRETRKEIKEVKDPPRPTPKKGGKD
eukprot:TRINITY_DN428_c0_g1_i4.p1 TRINITY_DN428_c0_g1~~TRINITY_DN428_c0_g1_i4.p1  ORF type:complete len:634 (-),score=129.67 TRINITY_DN428_c0_g1_i4:897-2798(-)